MSGATNKIFVGGLPSSCADDVLSNYFCQFGTITDCVVMKDRETGNSRGFGFVTYDSPAAVDMVMAQYEDHRINDKWVEVKKATPQDQMPAGGASRKGKGNKGGGKGGGPPPQTNADGSSRPGDWKCPNCGANCFASKDTCYKCGYKKPQAGGGGGGGSASGICGGTVPAAAAPTPIPPYTGCPQGQTGMPPPQPVPNGYAAVPGAYPGTYGPAPGAYGGFPQYGAPAPLTYGQYPAAAYGQYPAYPPPMGAYSTYPAAPPANPSALPPGGKGYAPY